ncbi:M20 family metallopeptidase [Arthrobacter roseus]|uniref:M20 family metallopeptidase n=1 Tax=Arthrobacter roseus TaxID=136274 RepID=UPI00196480C9|nr:M20 family metallopeptidase [Arthrobacter roseus]MBM7847394.1 acetylornithine deacetylase [Arthrobacter roseus]
MAGTDVERAVLDRIRQEDLVSLTCDLITAGGENPGGTEARRVAVLQAACQAAGLDVALQEVTPERSNLIATLPGGEGPPLMFLGHSDVVPAGDGWDHPAFEPILKGGRIFGRGSTDMLGGLAAVVLALRAIGESGARPPRPLQLVCTVDEEDLGLGIRHFTAGNVQAAACIVAEPTNLETVIGCRGDSYLEVRVTGRSAHSGRPEDGANAVDAASRILELVRADDARLRSQPDELLGSGTWSVGRIAGGEGTSMVAAECVAWIDRRLMPGEDAQFIVAALMRQVGEAGITGEGIAVEIDVTMEMPGFRTRAEAPLVQCALGAVSDVGWPGGVGGWTAGCDGGFIARDHGIPTIVLGPGEINEQAHQVNESVSVQQLHAAAQVYALLALRFG